MRTTHRTPRLARWGVALTVTGLLSLGGAWVRAQVGEPRQAPPVADRDQVPALEVLQATLTRLRRDASSLGGGPALEHAALALQRARTAETDAGRASANEDGPRARRIAYAALTLAEAQQERERARVARDEAARARHDAEGAERTAREALRVARDNAEASRAAAPTPAPVPPAAPVAPAAPQEGSAP